MQVDTEKDDGCIILSSESDSSSSNMNPPSTDKSSVQNCTTCESIDTCDTNSHSKKLEQPCDRKSPNHTTSSRMNIDSVNESSGRKLSLRTHSHTLDSTHVSM